MAKSGRGTPRWVHGVLLCLLLVLFVYNVQAWFFLGDDCFISFRYARHLADGEGLVWNPGERVEGYTNFLWVLFMAGSLRAGIPPEISSVALGVASGAGLLAALLLFSARRWGRDEWLIWLPPLALASSRSFAAWCSGGLETMFFTFTLFLAFATYLRERREGAPIPVASALLFAAATLTRPDGGLFALVAGLFFLGEILLRRRALRAGLAWVAPYALIVGAHLLWRHAYYGYWLPNSFYAKVPGAWWEQGWRYLSLFAEDYRVQWFLPLALVALLFGRRFVHVLFAAAIGLFLLYLLYVGGDRFEFRFLVVIFPYLYWLIADGIRLTAAWAGRGGAGRPAKIAFAAVAAAALLLTTCLGSWREESGGIRHGVAGIEHIRDYAARRAASGKLLRGLIDAGELPGDLVLCVGGAGALPYYTDWPTVDMRGINDVTVARVPVTKRTVIAHERQATYEYLFERRVVLLDMFNQVVFDENILANRPRIRGYGRVPVPLKAYRVGEKYLVFGTLVSDDEVRKIFGRLTPA